MYKKVKPLIKGDKKKQRTRGFNEKQKSCIGISNN